MNWESVFSVSLGALIGGCLPLFGIWLKNRSEDKRQAERIEYEKAENKNNKHYELRQSIYLEVMQDIYEANVYISELLDGSSKKGTPQLPKLMGISKIILIGSEEIVSSTKNWEYQFTKICGYLFSKRIPLVGTVSRCEYAQECRDLIMDKIDANPEEATEENRIKLDNFEQRRKQLSNECLIQMENMRKYILLEKPKLEELELALVNLVRQELKLPILDRKSYIKKAKDDRKEQQH